MLKLSEHKTPALALRVFSVILFAFCLNPSLIQSDCIYSFDSVGSPCGAFIGYNFIRIIWCANGDGYDVCCTEDLRPDIQTSRQIWFRSITAIGDRISKECTKSILCRMSCQDSFSNPRPDYPELMPRDTPQNKEYVDAYDSGEATCNKDPEVKNSTICEKECDVKYPTCQSEIVKSKLVAAFDHWARAFHIVGLHMFDYWWWLQDHPKVKAAIETGIGIPSAVEDVSKILLADMVEIQAAFNKTHFMNDSPHKFLKVYQIINGINPTKTLSKLWDIQEWFQSVKKIMFKHKGSDDNERWKKFIKSYTETDPRLLQILMYMDLDEFNSSVEAVKEALKHL